MALCFLAAVTNATGPPLTKGVSRGARGCHEQTAVRPGPAAGGRHRHSVDVGGGGPMPLGEADLA